MRYSRLIAIVLLLGACDGPVQVAADEAGEPAKSVMETEADKVCAKVTSFRADQLAGIPPEMQAKLRREYDLCVKSVASEESEGPPADPPLLRGRTTTP